MAEGFPQILCRLRKERHLNQRTAAAALHISQALLSHYENGLREPGLGFVDAAAFFYGVSVDYLLGRSPVRASFASSELPGALCASAELGAALLTTLLEGLSAAPEQSAGSLEELLNMAGYCLLSPFDRTGDSALPEAAQPLGAAAVRLLLARLAAGTEADIRMPEAVRRRAESYLAGLLAPQPSVKGTTL